jgi:mannosylglucosylglycerate synthase
MTKLDKPRVTILHYAAPPTIGGVEFTLAKHARLYADHGYPVKIIAGRGEAFDLRVPVEIITAADSRSPRVLQVNAELARGRVSETYHALVRELTDALERLLADCDVLMVHNALSLHKNLTLTAALKNMADTPRFKIVAWCHDFAWSDPQYAAELYPGFPWELLKRPWQGVKYVVVSQARKKELQELWGAREPEISVVPPGIDPCEFFGVTPETARWTRDLALLDAAPLLLLPARLTRRKNIERAIEIVVALRGLGLNAKLVVTGPPGAHNPTNRAYLEKLRALRQSRQVNGAVIFLHEFGEVQDTAMRDLYLLADALLFPSEREGFGIPLLEAALARLPIFCADLPSFHETARTHVRYFTRDEEPNAIAARIAEYLANDSAYQFKQRVRREFSWERIFAECLEPLVNEL